MPKPIKPTPKKPAPVRNTAPATEPSNHAALVAVAAEPPSIQTFNGTFTKDQVELVKRTICKGATDDELQLFLGVCQRTGLDPFARQIYSIERKTWNSETNGYEVTRSIQTGIDGFRVIAGRTNDADGQEGPFWCGPDGEWKEAWLDSQLPPVAAKVVVHRKETKFPFVGVARFDAYAQFYKKDGKWVLTQMWHRMGDVMIAKCAEALALRKAFPMQLGELRTTDEMEQADNPEGEIERTQKKERQAKAKIIEAGGKVESFTPEPKADVSTSTRSEDWREVESHVGNAGGPMLGKKVGEMVPAIIHWFQKEWLPKLPEQPLKKDAKLRDALLARIAAKLPQDAPESPESPAEAQTTTPEPQKAAGGAANAKKDVLTLDIDTETLPQKPIAWRDVVVVMPQSKATNGRTLGEIATAKLGQLVYDSAPAKAAETCAAADGLAWLRMLTTQGIPLILARKGDIKDKILVNAINAAATEMKAFDDPEWIAGMDEAGLRKEIMRRFTALGITEEVANGHLSDITKGVPIADLDKDTGVYLLENWSQVEAVIEEAKA